MADDWINDPYKKFRDDIDRIDSAILQLLNERAAAALKIGRLKRANNDPIHVPEREMTVLARMVSENSGPLSSSGIQSVFEAIIAQIRRLEESEVDGN